MVSPPWWLSGELSAASGLWAFLGGHLLEDFGFVGLLPFLVAIGASTASTATCHSALCLAAVHI